MKKPKITVIGAGTYFFGRPVIYKAATSEILDGGTLALVDSDPEVLDTMMNLAKRAFTKTGAQTELIGSTDRRNVIDDSDFVVLTFSHRNAHYRGLDTAISAKHGIRMCSSDTIGPGGIFRAMREIPRALEMAEDVRKQAPSAWVINFVNPTAAIGMALKRYAPGVKSFALCDGNHEPHVRLHWLKTAGILPEDAVTVPPEVEAKLDLAIGGVNHFTWLIRFNYDGKDMLAPWREKLRKQAKEEEPLEKAKPRYNLNYAIQLFDIYGAYPTAVSHTKEYVPFFQGYGKSPNVPEPLTIFDAENRAAEMAEKWSATVKYSRGELKIEDFLEKTKSDHATDIIESMWGSPGKSFYINTHNGGAVSNLPPDAFLELRCDLDMQGPRPQPFGKFPRGLLALQHQVLDTHALTVEAAVTGSRETLLRAMLADPIINNIGDAKNCMEEMLEAEKEALPGYWFR